MEYTKKLLRKRELIDALGVPKSTVADWVIEFQIFIPTVKQGATIYYLPEAIDVLMVIKELRTLDYAKQDIFQQLSERNFPINVKEDPEDIQDILNTKDFRAGMLRVIENIDENNKLIIEHATVLTTHKERMDLHEVKIDEQSDRLTELQQSIRDIKLELAATNNQLNSKKIRWWNIFKKKKSDH